MEQQDNELWQGLTAEAQKALMMRDYAPQSFADRLARTGIEAGKLASADRTTAENREVWIPGVEVFPRQIHFQRHRGVFGEFVRRDEGVLQRIGFWPAQWANARMFAQTAKGFHVHPPSIPEGTKPDDWMRRLFIDAPENYALRRYADEQWDVMFFVQGVAEMILRDVRAGMPTRTMRFFVDGDNHPGANNVGVVVPPGIAHAIRVEGSEDVIMVYGTSTSFHQEFEGRIGSEIETAALPESWERFLGT
jgi:dTDP-4-dehydrorhamnose 3,5-epimerase-like enzyme